MKEINSVIVGITSKKQFNLAVREAQKISALFEAKLYPVHVIEPLSIRALYPGSGEETVQRVSDEIRGEIHRLYPDSPEHPIEEPIVTFGKPAKEIAKVAHKARPSLIVMGRHKEGNFYSFGNSHSERLVKYAQCPVWIHPDRAVTCIPKRILCPLDFSKNCKRAAEMALNIAKKTGASIDFLHVMPTPKIYSGFDGYMSIHTEVPQINEDLYRRNSEVEMSNFLTELDSQGVEINSHIEFGEISNSISLFAKNKAAQLIVLGASSHNSIEQIFLGSTVHYVLHEALCDTLIVK